MSVSKMIGKLELSVKIKKYYFKLFGFMFYLIKAYQNPKDFGLFQERLHQTMNLFSRKP